jgi:aryl-alcohol dehydrogenase-like predicted oxidoreductase
MKNRFLGASGISLPCLGIGCWAFGGGAYWGEQSQKDVHTVVSAALDRGFIFFDTAEVYNDGESEIALGKALGNRRKEAIIASKISPQNALNVKEHCVASMKRLGTDYIDIYMLHWPINPLALKHFTNDAEKLNNPPTIESAYRQMEALKKEGLIRCIGMSNYGVKQMEEVIASGVQVDLNEITYNIVSRAIEPEIVPFSQNHSIAIIGAMALQQGLLSGKYRSLDEIPPHQAHSRHYKQRRGGAASRHGEEGAEEEILAVVDCLREIAAETGHTPGELAIAWILHKPFITSVLVGCRNPAQLQTNTAACGITLSKEIIQRIDTISLPVLKKLGKNPDYYENSKESRIF